MSIPSGGGCSSRALPLPTSLQPHQGTQGRGASCQPHLQEQDEQPCQQQQQQQQPVYKVSGLEPARQQQPTLDDARAAVAAAAAAAGPDVTHACLDAAALAATDHVQGRARTAVAALLPPSVPQAAVAAAAALVERSALARCATTLLQQVRPRRGRGLPIEGGECVRDAASGLVWEVMQQGRLRRERGGGRSQPLASGAGGREGRSKNQVRAGREGLGRGAQPTCCSRCGKAEAASK